MILTISFPRKYKYIEAVRRMVARGWGEEETHSGTERIFRIVKIPLDPVTRNTCHCVFV